nr:hypothetical protein [Tanacetum cinerariifolium]
MKPIDMVLELQGWLLELSRYRVLLVELEEDPASPWERLQGNPGRLYPAAVAVSDVPGSGTRVYTPAHGGSEAHNELPDLILSNEPKPLGKHRPLPLQSVWFPDGPSYPS